MKKPCKVLVTGGAGFIGSHIVDELLCREIETIVIDDLSTGSFENLSQHKDDKRLHLIVGDARHADKLLEGIDGIDVVFHEAAIASVPRSVSEPTKVHDVNVNMTLELMNFCVNKNIKRFVLRYFNVYGPRQKLSDYSGVITIFINKLLDREQPTIHGDGLQVRDFVFVKDIVRANILAMESENVVGESFNVASGNAISIKNLLETLQDITQTKNIGYQYGPSRAGDVRAGLASIEKIKNHLNYTPKTLMYDGLEDVINSIKSKISEPLLST
ncbi:MAG: NAD-dependent epimerase/dehydratase family protein [Thaumarchaeota archaeon]|nr:NAD-dependent epimerase/dehydratase family protein [Nitrososphaerota archaeon]